MFSSLPAGLHWKQTQGLPVPLAQELSVNRMPRTRASFLSMVNFNIFGLWSKSQWNQVSNTNALHKIEWSFPSSSILTFWQIKKVGRREMDVHAASCSMNKTGFLSWWVFSLYLYNFDHYFSRTLLLLVIKMHIVQKECRFCRQRKGSRANSSGF